MPISAVINTYNASEHLERVMSHLRGFDEIVVCDMESTDGTPELARRLGAKVVTFPKGSNTICEPARNTAIQAASSDWVLVVDDDELVPEALREHLYALAADPGDVRGWYIPRLNHVIGREDKSNYPDAQLRFVRRDSVDWPATIHSVPVIDGPTASIPAERRDLAMIHLQHDLRGMVRRANDYTTAEVAKRGVRRVTWLDMVVKPWVRFVKSFVLKGGWRMGMAGYIVARNNAYYKYLLLAKMYEARQTQRLTESKSGAKAPEQGTKG